MELKSGLYHIDPDGTMTKDGRVVGSVDLPKLIASAKSSKSKIARQRVIQLERKNPMVHAAARVRKLQFDLDHLTP